jgi:hypothetical protein
MQLIGILQRGTQLLARRAKGGDLSSRPVCFARLGGRALFVVLEFFAKGVALSRERKHLIAKPGDFVDLLPVPKTNRFSLGHEPSAARGTVPIRFAVFVGLDTSVLALTHRRSVRLGLA